MNEPRLADSAEWVGGAVPVARSPPLAPTHTLKAGMLGPLQELGQVGREWLQPSSELFLPLRHSPSSYPWSGRLWTGLTPGSCKAALAQPRAPFLPGGSPRPCEHKEGTGFFLLLHFRALSKGRWGMCHFFSQKASSWGRGGLCYGLEQAQCCFGGQHPV